MDEPTNNCIEENINRLTLEKVEAFMKQDASKIEKDDFHKCLDQAKLGMTFVRDREIMKRVSAGQTIRVINLVAIDSEERMKYIKASMPEMQLLKE